MTPTNKFSILIVDDDKGLREALQEILATSGYQTGIAADGVEAINALQVANYDCILLDLNMPRVSGLEVLEHIRQHQYDLEVIVLSGTNDVGMAVECMRKGAYGYILKPSSPEDVISNIEHALERKRLLRENRTLKTELLRMGGASSIIGQSKALLETLDIASRIAPTDSPVLIQGPSGSGKELIAHLIHRNSLRRDTPLIVLDCASLTETLLESELFGHEKGAFTDASQTKQGLVEIADGGTLFLDEIGEISSAIQPKLLRFMETGEFRRVGGVKTLKSDVRLISATNRDLRREVGQGKFREDLFYRLNVITLELPPLRARPEDIPLLIQFFLHRSERRGSKVSIDKKALDVLTRYEWPGNVRELENVITRAIILCREGTIRVEDLALPLGAAKTMNVLENAGQSTASPPTISLAELEKRHIAAVLEHVGWNKNLASKVLGISLKTLYTKIATYQLHEAASKS